MKNCRKSFTAVLSACLLVACLGTSCTPETAPSPSPSPSAVEPTVSASPTEPEKTEECMIDSTNSVETLGLCVTDGNFGEVAIGKAEMRFRDYVRVGIKTVRIETSWSSPAPGQWILEDAYVKLLQTAVKAGLRLKLILPTIMKPPTRIYNADGAKLVSEDGTENLQNTVSYWYDGLYDYTEDAIRCMLSELARLEILPFVDGIVVDYGPAGEPLYPAMWTQNTTREMLWCYGENAQDDFRRAMQEKYGTVENANSAWGTSFTAFSQISVPKPGTAKGKRWEDVLTWYRDVKRAFIDRQTDIFRNAVDTLVDGRIQLILYMPGEAYTDGDWETAVQNGTVTGGICICSENEYLVETARKYGALLQFTGLPGTTSVKKVLSFMIDNGYWDIPVFGENFADVTPASDPVGLGKICNELGLAGIDYTFTSYLYDATGYKKNEVFSRFTDAIPYYISAIVAKRQNAVPSALCQKEAAPAGSVLCLSLSDIRAGADVAVTLAFPAYTVESGDVLEYDVFVPASAADCCTIDGAVTGKIAFSANAFATHRDGQSVSSASLPAEGTWVHCSVTIGIDYNPFDTKANYVGSRFSSLKLTASPSCQQSVSVLYDNIVITNHGKTKYTIFADDADFAKMKKTEAISGCSAILQTQNLH